VVFSNDTMLLVSDKSDSVNEHAQEINKIIKLHILGVWQNDHEFIRQQANGIRVWSNASKWIWVESRSRSPVNAGIYAILLPLMVIF